MPRKPRKTSSAATQTGTDVKVCAEDVKDCFEKAKEKADGDITETSSDLQKCAYSASECFSCLTESDPAACISALPAPGAKLELGTEQDVEDVLAETQAADIAKFKSDANTKLNPALATSASAVRRCKKAESRCGRVESKSRFDGGTNARRRDGEQCIL